MPSDSPVKKQLPQAPSENPPRKNGSGALVLRSSPTNGLKFSNIYEHGYDPNLAEQTVRPDKLVLDPRFWRIANTLRALTVSHWPDNEDGALSPDARSQKRRKRARQLTQTLVELGPTFIKLGQFLSVRRDFLPLELSEELGLLQDRVPAFEVEQVRETIRTELGSMPEDLFKSFEFEPIASASIGQVHRAILNDGRLAAVKVQRPQLAGILYQDLGCMRWFAKFSKALSLKGDWDSWLELSDEFGKTLFEEIDYIKEGRNADRLRHALRDRQEILIPRVIWKYTGRRVITLEYLSGTKIDNVSDLDVAGFNRDQIGKKLIECYMDQVLTHGFFHADPHAGNLAINADGRIVLYDFGMMGEITSIQRESLLGCIAAVVNKNTADLTQHLVALGVIRQTANLAPIERALKPFIEYYGGRSIRDLDFSHLEKDIDEIAVEKALRLPPTLAYLIRTGATLEGIARTLKPDFSFVEAARPTLQKWVTNQPSQAAGIMRALYRRKVTTVDQGVQSTKESKATKNAGRPTADKVNTSANGKTELLGDKLLLASPRPEDLDQIKDRLKKLEIELKSRTESATRCMVLVIIQFVINIFLWDHVGSAKNGADTTLFVIGNALMGAIILWQLVAKPGSLLKRSRRPGN
jgi:predicted unusual protein kinase regulating ubiquinone biosynthesis (AarF/ABC1/UbiB family)